MQVEEGPCVEAFRTGTMVSSPDLSAEFDRWPLFAPKAIAQGFQSVHAVPLRLRKQTIGALNLFGTEVGALSQRDLQVANALADTATIGILHERAIRRAEVLTEQLQTALNHRVTIEQAKGMIAQAGDMDTGQAFEVLREHSRRTSTRLSAIAHDLVTGEMDPTVLLSRSGQPS